MAEAFRLAGAQVRGTPATGDFGADLIVQWNGASIAVQCKHHSSPVGIKAVQEALSARPYYGTHHAEVVVSSGYTAAAIDLARRSGVRLTMLRRDGQLHKVV